MSAFYIQSETLNSLADAIRIKTNSSSTFTPTQMASEIENIHTRQDELLERTLSGYYYNSKVTSIGFGAFSTCEFLTTVEFPNISFISQYGFRQCYNLLSVYLTGSIFCDLLNVEAFLSTPISDYTASTGGVYGSIYVPASLYSSYCTATNWSNYSSRFVSI